MSSNSRIFRCEECFGPNEDDFRKVAVLKKSGLTIYVHIKEKETQTNTERLNWRKYATFILHNTNNNDLKRPSYIAELCQYKTKCLHCKTLIEKVHGLLDEIKAIRKKETIGVCEYCKQSNTLSKCKRCEFVVNKFLSNKVQQREERQERLRIWLYNVKLLLQFILEGKIICKQSFYHDPYTVDELKVLLQELKVPLSVREPQIDFFPTTDDLMSCESLSENKDRIEELLLRLKYEGAKKHHNLDESLNSSSSNIEANCFWKEFIEKSLENKNALPKSPNLKVDKKWSTEKKYVLKQDEKMLINDSEKNKYKYVLKQDEKMVINDSEKNKYPSLLPVDTKKMSESGEKVSKNKINSSKKKVNKEKSQDDMIPNLVNEKEKFTKQEKPKHSIDLIQKSIRERQKMKKLKNKEQRVTEKVMLVKLTKPPIDKKLLNFKHHREEIVDTSKSSLDCGNESQPPKEMIKGTSIVPLDNFWNKEYIDTKMPLLYKVKTTLPTPGDELVISSNHASSILDTAKNTKIEFSNKDWLGKGIIRYKLSNREFIDKGWTKLPSTKIMRRMNIYKMMPANPKYDWFERHRNMKNKFYDTGEKLAEIDSNGRGKWFYKNGNIALDYFSTDEQNCGNRYIIFSSGEKDENGFSRPTTVLGTFDYLGNGVVYDVIGNQRLKYNQSEGIIIDQKIGPPSRWKWHDLNEPPILQPVFVDKYDKSLNTCLDEFKLSQSDNRSDSSKCSRETNIEMLHIELENFLKEKAHKLLQKFKPFQIKMKALKLNKQFSLRIMDQANIYLLFRDGRTSLKLNLGLHLISNEIVDTETAEVFQVATRYDIHPPRSQSIADVQNYIRKVKTIGKVEMGSDESKT
ncbi:uncharacterized protein LOC131849134 [Achroia grisella]|uniref:uncharacterized protein LOC131849134 n=1 Tax=Achroia grisella TaxID=688607 RepID=UPI0027D20406|nr:uncharacterized protein LOC131849134 [Achroia grisella]